MTRARLSKLSVCNCGFPVLAEHITVGTEYEISRDMVNDATLRCGGCKKNIPVKCIWVKGREPGHPPGWLPQDIFEDITDGTRPTADSVSDNTVSQGDTDQGGG